MSLQGVCKDRQEIETSSSGHSCEICWSAFAHLRLLHDAGTAGFALLLGTHCQPDMVTARRSAGLSLKKSGWMGEASQATAPILRLIGNWEFPEAARCGL